ncbi:MAG: indole-3-glycerol phosphate synthase TrpC [Candidatus Omnitrophota bacterium]|nr:MAG: indole-3-glycerol phosphate synthase TrpC [Candidatus Omnitrophota bacterium]
MPFLDKIIESKRAYLEESKKATPLTEIKKQLKNSSFKESKFLSAIQNSDTEVKIIGEIKKKSPSGGEILDRAQDILEIARVYKANGIVALSVLTEKEFFDGDVSDLKLVSENIDFPILRKDFIIEEYQIYESKLHGAHAVLLITRILDDLTLKKFAQLAAQLSLDVVFEVHGREELERVLPLNPKIIGINNRDLDTLKIDFRISEYLLPQVPEGILKIVESGIKSYQDIIYFKSLGADAFLIGEEILKAEDRAQKIRELIGYG